MSHVCKKISVITVVTNSLISLLLEGVAKNLRKGNLNKFVGYKDIYHFYNQYKYYVNPYCDICSSHTGWTLNKFYSVICVVIIILQKKFHRAIYRLVDAIFHSRRTEQKSIHAVVDMRGLTTARQENHISDVSVIAFISGAPWLTASSESAFTLCHITTGIRSHGGKICKR